MSATNDPRPGHAESLAAWETNAVFWDERMGDGNRFHLELVWPHSEPLLELKAGQRVLDVGCGNGLTCRRLVAAGVDAVCIDFSEAMIERARGHDSPESGLIHYRQIDATDEHALLALGVGSFDAVIANMVLMDMSAIAPLYRAVARLLKPGGRFVYSVMHPAFNGKHAVMIEEQDEDERTRWVKVRGYLDAEPTLGEAIQGQPTPQPYFMRPLHELLGEAFAAGLVMDAIVEPAFPPVDEPRELSWESFSDIPPVLIVRLRAPR